jgi:hypothetical protein
MCVKFYSNHQHPLATFFSLLFLQAMELYIVADVLESAVIKCGGGLGCL